jgi:hypothetical protein
MKANELRIGNYVRTYGQDVGHRTIVGITPEGVNLLEQDEKIDYNLIEPIPLTEDRLERFGLDRTNGYGWLKYGFNHGMVWFFIDIEKKRFQGKRITVIAVYDDVELAICDIEYVHQLQNLYFALTGEELEIK